MNTIPNSPVFQASFTDIYGMEHNNAQCMISSYSVSHNAYFEQDGTTTSHNGACNYQVRYWHSPEVKEGGARPLEYMDESTSTSFYMNLDAGAQGEDFMAKCQEHFINEVIGKRKA